MSRRSHPEAGVTLIEILIAVSLLSFLSIGILITMRIGFNTMEKVDSRMVGNRRVSYARRIVENEVAGFTDTLAEYRPGTPEYRVVPFTQWDAQTLRFVTSYSLQDAWRGRPQIAALQVIPGADGKGVRLIVNEMPYTGQIQAGGMIENIDQEGIVYFAPVAPGPQSFVLADKLAYCRFSYLEPKPQPPFQIWRTDWEDKLRVPQGIRIDMAPLDPSSPALQASAITMAVHVNRTRGVVYADQP